MLSFFFFEFGLEEDEPGWFSIEIDEASELLFDGIQGGRTLYVFGVDNGVKISDSEPNERVWGRVLIHEFYF